MKKIVLQTLTLTGFLFMSALAFSLSENNRFQEKGIRGVVLSDCADLRPVDTDTAEHGI